MTVEIVYFVHGTTNDNEKNIATGWGDCTLSDLGLKQTRKMSQRLKDVQFDCVFCSDLRRAVDSVNIIWGSLIQIIQDKRLRECNYGDLTGVKISTLRKIMIKHIDNPFPNGESYKEVEKRIRSFLEDLKENYLGRKVAILAHQAPQLALDVILNGKTWKQAIKEDWRRKQPKEWKPGWIYYLS
ncbi:MAG: histidine phosphatase family protein [Candidatus Heimdallarchaeota archaeon]|nr:MAG: histidine phosphatase family protein [Candidatus Heimdallarchaeota archaeon]